MANAITTAVKAIASGDQNPTLCVVGVTVGEYGVAVVIEDEVTVGVEDGAGEGVAIAVTVKVFETVSPLLSVAVTT